MSSVVPTDLPLQVQHALAEDIGAGDITAELISANQTATARTITRESCIIAGRPWVEEVFKQLDKRYHTTTRIEWNTEDGQSASANQTLFELQGNARVLLTGERTALNFLQLLSGTASRCFDYAERVKHTSVKLLDTRKTIPGLRTAQKYAVTCGNCHNHRMGLFDAFLIKENHIQACGGISQAASRARSLYSDKPIEIEVENLAEFEEAVNAKTDIIMLDNFSLTDLKEAVKINSQKTHNHRAKLEASGGVSTETLVSIAETGVDFISIGSLTKDCQAIDLSMRVV